MSCNEGYDSCGTKIPSRCVTYDGIVNSESSLQNDKCKNIFKVVEDIYAQLDSILDKLSLDSLDSDCLSLGDKPSIESVFQTIIENICDNQSVSTSCGCSTVDPCSGEVVTPNGLVYHSFANGNLTINSTSAWNYGTVGDLYTANMNHKVSSDGTYKISIEVDTEISGTNELLVGLSKNNANPVQDFSTLDGNFSTRRLNTGTTKTFNFIKELEKNDVIKLGFKGVLGTPTIESAIMVIEKVK